MLTEISQQTQLFQQIRIWISQHPLNIHGFGYFFFENPATALDNSNCAVGISVDFQKAFDTVDHCILVD